MDAGSATKRSREGWPEEKPGTDWKEAFSLRVCEAGGQSGVTGSAGFRANLSGLFRATCQTGIDDWRRRFVRYKPRLMRPAVGQQPSRPALFSHLN